MADAAENNLKRTPLYDVHVAHGGKIVPFAGYEMPVQFEGVKPEHLWTRAHAGLFDVSHMGQLILRGEGSTALLESLVPVDIQALGEDCQTYALLTNDAGDSVTGTGEYKVCAVAIEKVISGTAEELELAGS